jgi:hypothetical protein
MEDSNEAAIKKLDRLKTILTGTPVVLVIAIILLFLIEF